MAKIWNLRSLCRCCHKDGQFTDLRTLLQDSDTRNYATLMQETFNISMDVPLFDASYAICDTCIEDLIRAHNFKDQVVESEQKFHEYCQNKLSVNAECVFIQCDLKEEVESLHEDVSDSNDNCGFDDFEPNNIDNSIKLELEDVKPDLADDQEAEHDNQKVIKIKQENSERAVLWFGEGSPKKIKEEKLVLNIPPIHTSNQEVQKYVKDEGDERVCTLCNYVYKQNIYSVYGKHLQEEHSINIEYKCDDEKIFTNCRTLLKHNLYKQPKDKKTKPIADKHRKNHKEFFNEPTIKSKHSDNKTESKTKEIEVKKDIFFCKKCKFKTISYNKLVCHDIAKHCTDKKYYCNLCGKEFRFKISLEQHLGLVHYNLNIKKFVCKLCGHRFKDKSSCDLHRRTVHENLRPFKCELCPQTFKSSKALNIHKRKHTETRPYKCDECERAFYYLSSLEAHKQAHKNQRSTTPRHVVCKMCNETFPTKRTLQTHYKNDHQTSLPYVCDNCPKGFLNKRSKMLHMNKCRLHSGNNTPSETFTCEICQETYKQKFTLQRHMRLTHKLIIPKKYVKLQKCLECNRHYGDYEKHKRFHENPLFQCDICKVPYTRKSSLDRHMAAAHDSTTPYECRLCQKQFKLLQCYQKHLKSKQHNIERLKKVSFE